MLEIFTKIEEFRYRWNIGLIPRILIVSQNCVIRAGLRTLLGESGGYHSVAEASSCEAPLLQTLRTRPHIVLLEAGARLKDDISAVLSALPDAAVVAFSREDQVSAIRPPLPESKALPIAPRHHDLWPKVT